MSMITNWFQVNQHYSFTLILSGILPVEVNNVKIKSFIDGYTAERLGYNVVSKHTTMFPLIDQIRYTDNAMEQMYVEVEYPDGQRDCFGESWVVADTVRLHTKNTYIVEFEDLKPEELNVLRSALEANGFKPSRITTVNGVKIA